MRGTGFSASKCAFWVYIIGEDGLCVCVCVVQIPAESGEKNVFISSGAFGPLRQVLVQA